MKQFFSMVFLCWSCTVMAQSESYLHEFKKGKTLLLYSYIHSNDSLFLRGHLKENKTSTPIVNININIKDFRIGTVPTTQGDFTIFLPRQEGTIVFDKPGYTYFEFQYKFQKEKTKDYNMENPKRSSAHH